MKREEILPTDLKHKPIVFVNYADKDANARDAKFLSIGKAQWDSNDLSAKVIRWDGDNQKWARQSEELPLWRVLDLAKLLIATITGQQSTLNEKLLPDADKDFLNSFINENMELYAPRIKEISELINASYKAPSREKTPNIFSFATSELSQDAFFSWLIKWADNSFLTEDQELCKLGKNFVALLTTGLHPEEIHTINVGRQWCNIDIWVEINDNAFLVIEDKIGPSEHDNQLNRYRETVENEYKNKRDQLFFAYVKTENEPSSKEKVIREKGYKTINRQDLLKILYSYNGNNLLVVDYRQHLQELEDATNKYKYLPVAQWDWYAWQGFYKELEEHIEVVDWTYVPNRSGGFLCLTWNWKYNEEVGMYLQFEESKLCFKIEHEEENHSKIREKYHNILMNVSKEMGITIERPLRFGNGTYMTIGVAPIEEVFGSNKVNIENLVKQLKRYEQIVNKCMA